MTRKDLRAEIARRDVEIVELRAMCEDAQERGVQEGLLYAEEAVFPWQDYDSTVARLELLEP